jgi:simple sugar transport system permease protein
MSDVLGSILSLAFLAQMLRITVPYTLAALGGTLCERSGVINIALEGKLLIGALAAAIGAHYSGSVFVGAIAGLGAGVVFAGIYGLAVIRFRADQIVSGVALNLLALGLSRYILKLTFDSTANSPVTPGFEGHVLANPMFWLVVALVVALQVGLYRTALGLRIRAVGEHPEAADTLGVSVHNIRWIAVLAAGALAGLGGAWLALSNQGFVAEMSGGRGYIALAAVIMGKWRPAAAAAACLLFGFAEALQLNLQAVNIGVPRELLQTLPYVLTMVALAGFIGRSRAPAAIGQPYDKA